MSENSSSDDIAQKKQMYENFLKEVPERCQEAQFTKTQTDEIIKFAKSLEPSTESIEKVTEKWSEIAKQNETAKADDDNLKNGDDYKEFIKILSVTEELSETLTENDEAIIMDKFKVWLKEGKPKPQLPKESTEVEQISRIYRRKHNGKQFLSYVVQGKSEQIGMRTDVTFGKTPDGREDISIIIGRTRYPTIPYTEKLAKELVEKAKRHDPDGEVKLMFVFKQSTLVITKEKNFFGDFDKLVNQALNKQMI